MRKLIVRLVFIAFVAILFVSCGSDSNSGNTVDSQWAQNIKKGIDAEPGSAKAQQVAENVTAVKEDVKETSVDDSEMKAKSAVKEKEAAENKKAEEARIAAEKETAKLAAEKEARAVARKEREERKKREARRNAPKVKFEQTTHNYGMIMQGDEITHKFKFRNTGKSELVISNATASCGCTQPTYPFIPIAPGEEGFIGVNFNSTGKLGPQKPTITITTNASPKTYKLYLDGFVDAERAKDQNKKEEPKSESETGTEE